jgi:alpha-beta hydrolase superfamily lysophospholipase
VARVVIPEYISRDPEVVHAYVNDPLVSLDKITARLGAELLAAQREIWEVADRLALPVLLIQGGDDRLVGAEGTQKLYEIASSQDKTVRVYPGMYHETMNEAEGPRVVADLCAWLDARTPDPQTFRDK